MLSDRPRSIRVQRALWGINPAECPLCLEGAACIVE